MEAGKLKFENNRASLSYQHLEVAKPYFHNFTNKHVQKIFKRGQNMFPWSMTGFSCLRGHEREEDATFL